MDNLPEDVKAALAEKFTPHDGYGEHPLTEPRDDDRAGSQLGSEYEQGYRDAWASGEDDDDSVHMLTF